MGHCCPAAAKDADEFKIDFKAEIIAQEFFKKAINVEIIETCNMLDYDFKDSENIIYEVKADGKSHLTKRFFIEYGQKH